jgi:hypothetical protein
MSVPQACNVESLWVEFPTGPFGQLLLTSRSPFRTGKALVCGFSSSLCQSERAILFGQDRTGRHKSAEYSTSLWIMFQQCFFPPPHSQPTDLSLMLNDLIPINDRLVYSANADTRESSRGVFPAIISTNHNLQKTVSVPTRFLCSRKRQQLLELPDVKAQLRHPHESSCERTKNFVEVLWPRSCICSLEM